MSTRILLGFVVLLLAFSAAGAYSVYRLRRASEDLRILSQGHLRLAFALGDLEAIQSSLVSLTRDGQTVGLAALRRMRLRQLADARQVARETLRLEPNIDDVAFLRRTVRNLRRLEDDCRQSEAKFEQLFGSSPPGKVPPATALSTLALRESGIFKLVQSTRDLAKDRATALAVELEQAEARAVWTSLGLVVLALVIGLGAALSARRTLRPLRQLAEGARSIGAGSYDLRIDSRCPDEIGLVANEFNQMAAALQERERRLVRSERLAAAGKVAGHVAHEIRNPLSSIGLNLDLLEEEVGSEEAKGLLVSIRRQTERLEALTEEYLRFGRLPQPKLQTEEITVIIRELLDFLGEELKTSGIEVRTELTRVPEVSADESQLRQALLNVMRNAKEAMHDGGTLAVRTKAHNGHVEVIVSDTGPGMSSDVAERLFEPFFTTKDRGTGLGLALTHQIVTEHGGQIEVETAPGRGTTFVVKLPTTLDPSA